MDPILGPENGPDSGARKRTRSWVQKMSTNLCPENGPDSGARKWTAFWVQKMDTNPGPENGRSFKPAFLKPQNRILEAVCKFWTQNLVHFLAPESGSFSGPKLGFMFAPTPPDRMALSTLKCALRCDRKSAGNKTKF